MLNQILDTIGRGITALSPIKMFEAGEYSKLASMAHQQLSGVSAGDYMSTIFGIGKGLYTRANNAIGNAYTAIKSNTPGIARGIGDYMSGYKLGLPKSNFTPGTLQFNKNIRIGAAAALGVGAGASLMYGNDNYVNNAMGIAGKVGIGLAGYGVLSKLDPKLGMIYGGLSMINLMR